MARLSDDFLNEIKLRNDIESVISSYVSLKRRGSNLVGLCPFHNEKTPSFTVYPETQSYYCFGCSAGGEAITFIRQIEHLEYMEAVKLLADRVGLAMPDERDDGYTRLKQRILLANKTAAKFFHKNLMAEKNKKVLNYLSERGLSPSTIKHFGLGYAENSWNCLYNYLKNEGFEDFELESANLIVKGRSGKYYDMFRNRPIFPIIDLRGNVIAFGGRALGDDTPKYLNSADTPVFKKSKELFALYFAKKYSKEQMILTEGYMDVIALHQAGFQNAVATLGTSLTSEHARVVSLYTDEVIISYDSDTAGRKALERAIKIFSAIGTKVRVLEIRDAKDPDEFIKHHGPERFKALLAGAENDIEYRILKARENLNLETSAGKVEFLSKIARILSDLDSAIERDVYAAKLAYELNVDKMAILGESNKIFKANSREKQKKEEKSMTKTYKLDKINPDRNKNPRMSSAEEGLIALMLRNPDFYSFASNKISAQDFFTSFNQRLFSFIMNSLRDNLSVELNAFTADFNPEEVSRIVQIQNREKPRANTKEEALRCIHIIKEENTKIRKSNVAEMSDDEWEKYIKDLSKNKK